MENPICPACGRALGLYNKNGEMVGCEYHYVMDIVQSRPLFANPWTERRLFFTEVHELVCFRFNN